MVVARTWLTRTEIYLYKCTMLADRWAHHHHAVREARPGRPTRYLSPRLRLRRWLQRHFFAVRVAHTLSLCLAQRRPRLLRREAWPAPPLPWRTPGWTRSRSGSCSTTSKRAPNPPPLPPPSCAVIGFRNFDWWDARVWVSGGRCAPHPPSDLVVIGGGGIWDLNFSCFA